MQGTQQKQLVELIPTDSIGSNHEKFVYANGNEKNLFYIFGGKELTGLYMQSTDNSTQSSEMGYVISDHLGSVWTLANESGGFIEQ